MSKVKLIFTGQAKREFPGVGVYKPGDCCTVGPSEADKLLKTGFFKVDDTFKKKPTEVDD